ncbi:hypothetical protein KY284_010422 [Solanum tuberosum]|nr:hypothetical protein KY284_010422 [Solanum tuberosum]
MRKLPRIWHGSLFLTFFQPFLVKSLFSLATAIGKPLQLDQATINQSSPSCAKVRVLVDLAASLPKAVSVRFKVTSRARDCGQREGRGRGAYQGTNEMSNVEEKVNLVDNNKDEDESTLLIALRKEDRDNCSSWYLDNGASNHMCGHKDKFVEIKKTVKGNVSFGETSKIQIEGIVWVNFLKKDMIFI